MNFKNKFFYNYWIHNYVKLNSYHTVVVSYILNKIKRRLGTAIKC